MKLPFYLLEDGESSEENGGILYSTSAKDRALLIKKTLDAGHVIYGFENNVVSRLFARLQIANIRNSWLEHKLSQREVDNYDYLNSSPCKPNNADAKALFKVTSIDAENRTVEIEVLEDNPDAIGESVSFHFVCIENKENNTMKAVGVTAACFNDK